MSLGQASAQRPQPVHLSSMITGSPFSPMYMASNWQASTQSPRPMHPYVQNLSPLVVKCSILQLEAPWYLALRGATDSSPWHITTATGGVIASASMPSSFPIASVTSGPPTVQRLIGAFSFIMASAYWRQPGYPQAPQLAPGRISSIWSIRGSSCTLSFL